MSRPTALRTALLALCAAASIAGCAGIPPAGTPEHAAWTKERQALAAAIEVNGRYGDSLRNFPLQSEY